MISYKDWYNDQMFLNKQPCFILLGIGSKISLVADVIRSVNSGKNSLEEVIEDLVKQPLVLGSDIESIVPLARTNGCLTRSSITSSREFLPLFTERITSATNEIFEPMPNRIKHGCLFKNI
jgi:hypothetical protein